MALVARATLGWTAEGGCPTWALAIQAPDYDTTAVRFMIVLHDQRQTHRRGVARLQRGEDAGSDGRRNCPNWSTSAFWWTITVPTAPSRLRKQLGLQFYVHDRNYGYGRNQQTCYREALAAGADVVIMVHPDYQYTPLLVTAMASMVAYGVYDVVLGSRIIGGQALRGGMPFYKYVANRLLTAFENLFLGIKLSEYHTGYRAFSREVLTELAAARKLATTLSSTTRCWRSACTSVSASAKCRVRRNISRKRRRSTSGAA